MATAIGDAPLWLEIVRAVLVGLGGVILGMAFQVFTVYAWQARHPSAMLPRHIALISLSYCLLIIATAGTQFELLIDGAAVTWRVPLISVAYILGIVALRTVLIHVAARMHGPRRRAGDP